MKKRTLLIDSASLATNTYYYPSSTGARILETERLIIDMVCSGGATVTVEACYDADPQLDTRDTLNAAETWRDITAMGASYAFAGRTGYSSFLNQSDTVDFGGVCIYRWRVKVVTSGTTIPCKIALITDSKTAGVLPGAADTVSQGTPAAAAGAWPVKPTDGANPLMGTATAAADNIGNPTLGGLLGFLLSWDGTQWRRLRSLLRTYGAESPACTDAALVTRGVESRTIIAPYSTRKGHGTAVYLSDTTITFNGPAIVAGQILKVIASDGVTIPRKYESGLNAGFTVAGTGPYTITILGCGAHPITVADSIEVIWVAQDQCVNASLNAMHVVPMSGPQSLCDTPFAIASATSFAKSDTVTYYPASTGMDMTGFADIAFDVSAVAGTTTSPLYVWIEACDDSTFPSATALPTTSPLNITCNCNAINSIVPLGNQSFTATAGATLRQLIQAENLNFQFVRVCMLQPAANAANGGAITIYARRKYQ